MCHFFHHLQQGSLLVGLWIGVISIANTNTAMEQAYQQGLATGASEQALTALQNFDPEAVLPGATHNPTVSHYYNDNTDNLDLTAPAQQALNQSDAGQALLEITTTQATTTMMDINDPSFEASHATQDNAQALVDHWLQGEDFCSHGDCIDDSTTPNDNFNTIASSLSTLTQAGEQLDGTYQIFPGQAMTCREKPIGFKDCCADKGWGIDLHLAQCSQAEQQLGYAKQQGLSIVIGRYCAKRKLGVCLTHKRSYCVFASKQARIVQAQARRQQLGLSFGASKHPNCSGFSVEQFAQINFEKINFSEWIDDLHQQMALPDNADLQTQIIEQFHPENGS